MESFTTKKIYEIPLGKAELASMLKVTPRTLNREMAAGKLKFSIVGGRVRFFDSQIQAYLNLAHDLGEDSYKAQMAANFDEACGE